MLCPECNRIWITNEHVEVMFSNNGGRWFILSGHDHNGRYQIGGFLQVW